MRRAVIALSSISMMILVPSLAPAQTAVTGCGQIVAGAGVLTGDLDCSGTGLDAVVLDGKSSLDLAGFTLTADASHSGVVCDSTCTVASSPAGGTLAGGIRGIDGASNRVTAREIRIVGAGYGILGGRVSMSGVEIDGASAFGAWADKKLRIENSLVVGCDSGVGAERMQIFDSTVDQSVTDGVTARVTKLKDSSITNSGGDGIHISLIAGVKIRRNNSVSCVRSSISGNAGSGVAMRGGGTLRARARLTDCAIDGNGGTGLDDVGSLKAQRSSFSSNGLHGVALARQTKKATFDESIVDNNARSGILHDVAGDPASPVLLKNGSTAASNGTSPDCGSVVACADVDTPVAPLLASGSTCGTSHVEGSGIPGLTWGVCALD